MSALPGSAIPSVSHIAAMVDAVPMTPQWPGLRMIAPCRSAQSSSVILPARSSCWYRRQSVHVPNSSPRQLALSCGPPVTMIAGTSALIAPISIAGVVLSHPASSTTPSSGFARTDSSTSMLIRLR